MTHRMTQYLTDWPDGSPGQSAPLPPAPTVAPPVSSIGSADGYAEQVVEMTVNVHTESGPHIGLHSLTAKLRQSLEPGETFAAELILEPGPLMDGDDAYPVRIVLRHPDALAALAEVVRGLSAHPIGARMLAGIEPQPAAAATTTRADDQDNAGDDDSDPTDDGATATLDAARRGELVDSILQFAAQFSTCFAMLDGPTTPENAQQKADTLRTMMDAAKHIVDDFDLPDGDEWKRDDPPAPPL